ncbi:probable glutathione S-transferase isoform X2 [Andrographis paniculata]|nr:probable glutathione S-transferase isoform X2 [Andrographis paniculata]
MRARLALSVKGIPYQNREEDLSHKSPLLLQANPIHKKVPVLIHNGKPVCESLIIVEYVDEAWRDRTPPLMPSHPYDRAQARFWADVADKKLFPAGGKLWTTKGRELEANRKEFIRVLKLFEAELGEKPYFGGQSLGFLDVALAVYCTWFQVFEVYGNFRIKDHCPKVAAWGNRCMDMDTVSKALPHPNDLYQFVSALRNTWFA